MADRISRFDAEVISNTNTPARITSESVEVLSATNPPARVSSKMLEVLSSTTPVARVSSLRVEVLNFAPNAVLAARHSRIVVEVLSQSIPEPVNTRRPVLFVSV